jgi:molybdopterin molybdotransferase
VFRRTIEVRTRDDITLAAPLTHFMRAIIDWDAHGASAKLTGPQGSGLLTSMALANALLVVPPDRMTVRAGETVRAMLLGERSIASTSLDV